MRKVIYILLCAAVTLVVVAVGARIATAHSASPAAGVLDAANPLVRPGTLYVRVGRPERVDAHGLAYYNQTAVRPDGSRRPIAFMGMHKLRAGHYLALSTKGAYVRTYREVTRTALPAPVQRVLVP